MNYKTFDGVLQVDLGFDVHTSVHQYSISV